MPASPAKAPDERVACCSAPGEAFNVIKSVFTAERRDDRTNLGVAGSNPAGPIPILTNDSYPGMGQWSRFVG